MREGQRKGERRQGKEDGGKEEGREGGRKRGREAGSRKGGRQRWIEGAGMKRRREGRMNERMGVWSLYSFVQAIGIFFALNALADSILSLVVIMMKLLLFPVSSIHAIFYHIYVNSSGKVIKIRTSNVIQLFDPIQDNCQIAI